MDLNELEIKKFELEQRVKLEELDLKKKELELRIQEQRSKRISTPLLLSIIGGFITILTGVTLNHFDSKSELAIEDKKLQSSLLIKATESKDYHSFSDMLMALTDSKLINLDSIQIQKIKKMRFLSEKAEEAEKADTINQAVATISPAKAEQSWWTIVAGGDANLKGAEYELNKAKKAGYDSVGIWFKGNSYRTCIGKYSSRNHAFEALFDIKERLNNSSYVVRFDEWCPVKKWDPENKIYICTPTS